MALVKDRSSEECGNDNDDGQGRTVAHAYIH